MLVYGWRCFILAASTEHKTGFQRLKRSERFKKCQYDGVEFLWIRTPGYRGNGFGRVLNMLGYTVRALLPNTTRLLPRPDVIVGSSVHPFAGWAGAILSRRFGVPFIFEVRDIWPQTLVDMNFLAANSCLTRFLLGLEKWLYRKAARIIVLLPGAAHYIVSKGIKREKIEWIPNGVELGGYRRPGPAQKKDKFTLMYFGAHGAANGLDCLIRAMVLVQKRLGPSRIELRLIGDGPQKKYLINLAKQEMLDNVFFENSVPKQQIPSISEEADAFVFTLVPASVFQYGISANKLFDYMAGARPVIFSCESLNNPVMEAKAGITVPPGDQHALADAICKLAQTNKEKLHEMGKAARIYVEKYHGYDGLAEKFSKALDESLKKTEKIFKKY